ncbi:short transient receptor potential channel 7-like [Glandiceps talaboti]
MAGNKHRRMVEQLFLAATEKGDKKMFLNTLDRYPNLDINCVNEEGLTALALAIQIGNTDIVQILLDHDADIGDALLRAVDVQIMKTVTMLLDDIQKRGLMNEYLSCHSLNGDLHPDITPIILAAHHNNYDIIKLLLDLGAKIDDPEYYAFKTEQFTLQHSLGLINVYRALASQAYIALTSTDPINTAFELNQKLQQLSLRDYEFRMQYEELADQCGQFAADLLGQVRDSEEQAIILNHDPDRVASNGQDEPYKVRKAIKFHQKKFVAHPHCQQRLIERWYKGLPDWREQGKMKKLFCVSLIGIFYPFLCLAYIFVPTTKISDFMKIPYIRFLCHTASSIWFLVLLGLQAVDWDGGEDSENIESAKWAYLVQQQQRVRAPSSTELLIIAWIVGMTWQECRVLWKKGYKSFLENIQWKVFDFITFALYWGWIALRLTVIIKEAGSTFEESFVSSYLKDLYLSNFNFSLFAQYSEGYFLIPSEYDSLSSNAELFNEDTFGTITSINETFEDMEFGSALDDIEVVRRNIDTLNGKIDSLIGDHRRLEVNLSHVLSAMTEKLEHLNNIMSENINRFQSRGSVDHVGSLPPTTFGQSDSHLERSARKRWHAFDPVLISEGLFAVAKVFSFLRVIRITVVSMHVGPMQISLGRMMMDIVKFLMIFSLVWFAFSVGLNQLYWYYSYELKLDCKVHNKTVCPQPFGTIPDALGTLFWALFGVTEVNKLDIEGADHWFTENVGRMMYAAYHVIAIVVLLNVLIAMMSNTYTHVEEDADIVWKYARSGLWVSFFGEGETLPPPFNVLPTVWCIAKRIKRLRRRLRRHRTMLENKLSKESMVRQNNKKYEEVVQRLVRRYIFDKRRRGDDEDGLDPVLTELKQDITGLKYDMSETLSNVDDKMKALGKRLDEIEAMATGIKRHPSIRVSPLMKKRSGDEGSLSSVPEQVDAEVEARSRERSSSETLSRCSTLTSQSSKYSTRSTSLESVGDTSSLSSSSWNENPDALVPLREWGHISYIDEVSSYGTSSNTSLHSN